MVGVWAAGRHGRPMGSVARAVIANGPRITGPAGSVIAELVAETGPLWAASGIGTLRDVPGDER